jgi:hypothetical protein
VGHYKQKKKREKTGKVIEAPPRFCLTSMIIRDGNRYHGSGIAIFILEPDLNSFT